MTKMINVNSPIEEKADACRNFIGKKVRLEAVLSENGRKWIRIVVRDEKKNGAWAFEYEGKYYCPFNDEKTSCAGNEKRTITKRWYRADRGLKETTEEYYVCSIRRGK
jgi:hypothetical protein